MTLPSRLCVPLLPVKRRRLVSQYLQWRPQPLKHPGVWTETGDYPPCSRAGSPSTFHFAVSTGHQNA